MMKKYGVFFLALLIMILSTPAQPQEKIPRTLLPPSLLLEIINESSGELALQNEIFLTGVTRNRKPEEYRTGYFETAFVLEKMKEYGFDEAAIIDLPARGQNTWDAEEAELWLLEPEKKKIADLKEIAASLCSGSSSTDTAAELVDVGPGYDDSYYKDKDIKDKIVLVYGPPERARQLAVEKYGAKGIVGCFSSHPEFDPDQVGFASIRVSEKDKPAFAFMLSERAYHRLKQLLEAKVKVVVRAIVKTSMVPYKEEMAAGLIKGTEKPEQELVFTAHLFEGFIKQGANDDASGCVAILEAGRVIKKLVIEGKIPPLKRSIRFLFVPEISGTRAYIQKYPEISKRFFANINEDMVGEALVKNLSLFKLETTPYSLPTYLNDVAASFVEWMGASQRISQDQGWSAYAVLSPAGSRDPFYFSIDRFTGGSDHIVFIDGSVRVPAVMFVCWPDMWYHTGGDLPDKSDSTQLKRVVTLSVASAIFLANAGPQEARAILNEVSWRGMIRLAQEKGRAEDLVLQAEGNSLAVSRKEAVNILVQAFLREKEALCSAGFYADNDSEFLNALRSKLQSLDKQQEVWLKELEQDYQLACVDKKVKPEKLTLTQDEIRLSKMIPVRSDQNKEIDRLMLLRKFREMKPQDARLFFGTGFELQNFIDGRRSILDIRNAVSAEYEPLLLADAEKYFSALEKVCFVTIKKK